MNSATTTTQKSATIESAPYYFENFDWFEKEHSSFNPFGTFLNTADNDFEVDGIEIVDVKEKNKPMRSWFDMMEEDEEEERKEQEAKMFEDRQSLLITLNLRKILLSMGMYELEDGEVLDLYTF